MALRRKTLEKLLEWKNRRHKLALLVKGARQVGKTFSIRELGKTYKNFIEINFEKQAMAKRAFMGDLDARTIILNLSIMGFGNFEAGKTLVFFDEIQSCPQARTAIKFLVEDGRFDYIESGSLLGINYKEVSSYPVGFEEQIAMFPLDFEEFLWAAGINSDVIDKLREHYTTLEPLDEFLHEQIMKTYREYLIVGGMPASVNAFLGNDDINETLRIQNVIITNYHDDISKYAGKDKGLAKAMFDAIPQQLNSKNKRFILADLEEGAPARKYENALMWLVDAGIAYTCFNVSALELPLAFNEKRNLYKLYLHDTGLLCSLSTRGIQAALLNDEMNVNEGGITENAVAAALAKKGIPLNYYDRKSRAELDFVFLENNKISIIEVKSGRDYKKHASLDRAYEAVRTGKQGRRIALSKHNMETGKNGVIYMPLYMTMFFA